MVTIEEAKQIIQKMSDCFDSHDFINQYCVLYEKDYVQMLYESIESDGIFRAVDASIGKFLENNQRELSISKTDKEMSQNIKGNITECQGWKKI